MPAEWPARIRGEVDQQQWDNQEMALLSGFFHTTGLTPPAEMIRMLVAAILVPSATRRPEVDAEDDEIEKDKREEKDAPDPCATQTIPASVRRALSILRSFLGESPSRGLEADSDEHDGAVSMLYALPGHEPVTETELDNAQPSAGPASPGRPTRAARPKPLPVDEDGEEDIGQITQLGDAIGQLPDIWAVLRGEYERDEDDETRPKRKRMDSQAGEQDNDDELAPPPFVPGGWELLDIIVEAWEIDSNRRQRRHGVRFSAELLRQIPHRHVGGRQNIEPILRIIVEAFAERDLHASDTVERSRQHQIAARLFVLLLELIDTPGLLDRDHCLRLIAADERSLSVMLESQGLSRLLSLLPGDRLPIARVQIFARLLHATTVIPVVKGARHRASVPPPVFTTATPAAEPILELLARHSAGADRSQAVTQTPAVVEDMVRHMTLTIGFLYALSSAYPELALDAKALRTAVDTPWAPYRRLRPSKAAKEPIEGLAVLAMRKDLLGLALARFVPVV